MPKVSGNLQQEHGDVGNEAQDAYKLQYRVELHTASFICDPSQSSHSVLGGQFLEAQAND